MNNKNVWIVVAILVIFVGGFLILNKKSAPSTTVTGDGLYSGTIKVGHLVATDMAPLFIAKEAGYFKDEGLDVETVFFSNPGDNNAALTGGSLQFSINPFTLAYLGQNSGVPMRILANAGGNGIMQVVVQGKYNINSLDELVLYITNNPKEKLKVGTLRGDTLDMILYKAFKDKGLSYDNFEMIWFDDLLAMVQSFKTGDIAILSHIQPYTTDLQMNYGAKLLTDNAIIWGKNTPNTTIIALDSFAKKYPETVKRFLRAENRALDLIKNDPEKAEQILVGKNYFKTPDNVLLTSFKTQSEATLYPNIEGMMMAINDMVAQNYIKKPTINIVDTSYLDAALKK
jgi:ABC-type nitrate/sulfonate/bicarbonate transport system substrate-binding protein